MFLLLLIRFWANVVGSAQWVIVVGSGCMVASMDKSIFFGPIHSDYVMGDSCVAGVTFGDPIRLDASFACVDSFVDLLA